MAQETSKRLSDVASDTALRAVISWVDR